MSFLTNHKIATGWYTPTLCYLIYHTKLCYQTSLIIMFALLMPSSLVRCQIMFSNMQKIMFGRQQSFKSKRHKRDFDAFTDLTAKNSSAYSVIWKHRQQNEQRHFGFTDFLPSRQPLSHSRHRVNWFAISEVRTDFTDYLTVYRLSLLNSFTFISVFSIFSFLNRFPLQLFLVPYSWLLLSTPLLVFLVNQPHYHCFFSFFSVFRFHKFLVLMH